MRQSTNSKNWIISFLNRIFIEQKLDNFFGYLFVSIIALTFSYLLSRYQFLGFGLLGLIIGVAGIVLCLLNTEAGLYLNIIYSFFAFHLNRFLFNDSLPVGVGSDILVVATFLGLFIRKNAIYEMPKSSVIAALIALYLFLAMQLFNPYAHSFQGWFLTFRKILAEFMLLIIAYNIFTSYQIVKRFIIALFILCTICGLYGCLQQFNGLFDFEVAWVISDSHRFGLIFIGGDYRKFATMSDPTAYGVIMAASSVFFLVLASGQKRMIVKIILYLGIMAMVLGMSFSGTRTANAMLIGGIVIFILMTINKKNTQLFAIAASLIFAVLMYGPYSNSTINRFRTTFLGDKDESFKVRMVNKAFIQPYILSHPIGGGMRTSGGSGLQYNPGHRLAGFPPDSGYLKMALEGGWIGLALLCILYFVILRSSIKIYFSINDERLKIICAACTAMFFSLYVAQYAQDAIGQITDIVVYYPLIALTLSLKKLDLR